MSAFDNIDRAREEADAAAWDGYHGEPERPEPEPEAAFVPWHEREEMRSAVADATTVWTGCVVGDDSLEIWSVDYWLDEHLVGYFEAEFYDEAIVRLREIADGGLAESAA